ncbi:H-NS histone family protein [Paraburkholderia youngii]|uniref:H-NS histone family protein n=1 Tax=Paraburkholderia youngii TaxID=2782701 RepID=UPI0015909382|nr:H-NS histone family protein [Paraburkholderia youngii]NUX58718.1 H-NS histone family protein [Paraburkholderia youngii]
MNQLKEMEAQLKELQARYNEERTRVRTETLDALRDMLASGTLTHDDLRALIPRDAPANPRSRKKPPKYRDPHSGDTWTGQGAEPNWIKGKDRFHFLIRGSTSGSQPT